MRLDQVVNPVAGHAAAALRFVADAALAASRSLEKRTAARTAPQKPVVRASQPPVKAAQAAPVPPQRVWPNRAPSEQVLPKTAQAKQVSLDGVRPKPAIDPARRGRALGMLGRGEQVHSIAGALQAPRNEIELLLKAKRLMNSGA